MPSDPLATRTSADESPAAAGPGLTGLTQISVNVHDLPRATAFYRDVLGLRFLFSGGPKLAFFDCGGVRLMLGIPEEPRFDHPSSVLYFTTADIQASWDALIAAGATPERGPERLTVLGNRELWLAFFQDSEGNFLALMSEVPIAG